MQVSGARWAFLIFDLFCKRRFGDTRSPANLPFRPQPTRGARGPARRAEEVQTSLARGDGKRNEEGRQGGDIYEIGEQKGRPIDPVGRGRK